VREREERREKREKREQGVRNRNPNEGRYIKQQQQHQQGRRKERQPMNTKAKP
jgi:hypothetical protein